MELKELIVNVLSQIDGTCLRSGVIHFDIAVWPDDNKVMVATPRNADQGLSRVQFDVGVKGVLKKEQS